MGYGGADRVTLNLLQNLDRDKYQPHLALMKAEGVFMSKIPEDVPVYDLKAKSLWFMTKPLTQLLKKRYFDILYSTCGGASIPLMMVPGSIRKKSIVVVSERNILAPPHKNNFKRKLMLFLKRKLYPKADHITAVSRGVASEIETRFEINPNKIHVVNNPVITADMAELMKHEIKDPEFLDDNYPVILMAGRFDPQKNYPMMFEAFSKVCAQSNAHLFILGKGPLENELKQLASDMQIEDRITFRGYDTNPYKYMSRCHVFALSSDHEGMPGVLIQAMACGAACVSTNCRTGPSELIQHGVNGFLVKTGDPEDMADHILRLLADQDLAIQFGVEAKESVDRYHSKAGIQSYFSFLE